jgi:hypothetical protein
MTHVQDAAEIQASRDQIMTINDKTSMALLASKVMEPDHKMKALPPQIEYGRSAPRTRSRRPPSRCQDEISQSIIRSKHSRPRICVHIIDIYLISDHAKELFLVPLYGCFATKIAEE